MTFWACFVGVRVEIHFPLKNNYLVHLTKNNDAQSANSWNRISLLQSVNKLLKDDNANKQRFIEIVVIFYESNIQSRHNKNTLSTIIHKSTNAGSNNTVLETKVKQRIKSTVPIKDGKPVLENQISLAKWLSVRCYWRFHNKISKAGKYQRLTLSKVNLILVQRPLIYSFMSNQMSVKTDMLIVHTGTNDHEEDLNTKKVKKLVNVMKKTDKENDIEIPFSGIVHREECVCKMWLMTPATNWKATVPLLEEDSSIMIILMALGK